MQETGLVHIGKLKQGRSALSVTRTYAGIRAFAYRKAKARQVEQAMLFYLRIQEPMQESGLLQIGKLKQGRSSRPAFFFYLRTQEPMQESGFLHI